MTLLRKLAALPPADRKLLVEGACLLLAVRAGLAVVPFPLLRKWLLGCGRRFRERSCAGSEPARVAWAVRIGARYLNGWATCLAQALCGQLMLSRRGYPARVGIGVSRTPAGEVEAHAWLESGGVLLLGGPSARVAAFTRIGTLEVDGVAT